VNEYVVPDVAVAANVNTPVAVFKLNSLAPEPLIAQVGDRLIVPVPPPIGPCVVIVRVPTCVLVVKNDVIGVPAG
jgi:hypothetical protein